MRHVSTLEALRETIAAVVELSDFSCRPMQFSASESWSMADGALRHKSGGFFAVRGLICEANEPDWHGRAQPIIDQRTPAMIGLLIAGRGADARLVMQARAEPGNIGVVQIAPTVQSTRANYLRLHGGAPTPFAGIFLQGRGEILSDVMQSEEGSRYFGKYNHCVTTRVTEIDETGIPAQFFTLPFDLLKGALATDNAINTDARSALVCADWRALTDGRDPFEGDAAIAQALGTSFSQPADTAARTTLALMRRLSRARLDLRLFHRLVPLTELAGWTVSDDGVTPNDGGRFSIRQYEVVARGREVPAWDQPLIDSTTCGRVVLICAERDGCLKFLIRLTREIGLKGGIEFGPSLVVEPGLDESRLNGIDRAIVDALERSRAETIIGCRQSEEGGRFYQDENSYEVVMANDGFDLSYGETESAWVTLAELKMLIDMQGTCTIELRCAVALLLTWL